jgi:hypothetical protein
VDKGGYDDEYCGMYSFPCFSVAFATGKGKNILINTGTYSVYPITISNSSKQFLGNSSSISLICYKFSEGHPCGNSCTFLVGYFSSVVFDKIYFFQSDSLVLIPEYLFLIRYSSSFLQLINCCFHGVYFSFDSQYLNGFVFVYDGFMDLFNCTFSNLSFESFSHPFFEFSSSIDFFNISFFFCDFANVSSNFSQSSLLFGSLKYFNFYYPTSFNFSFFHCSINNISSLNSQKSALFNFNSNNNSQILIFNSSFEKIFGGEETCGGCLCVEGDVNLFLLNFTIFSEICTGYHGGGIYFGLKSYLESKFKLISNSTFYNCHVLKKIGRGGALFVDYPFLQMEFVVFCNNSVKFGRSNDIFFNFSTDDLYSFFHNFNDCFSSSKVNGVCNISDYCLDFPNPPRCSFDKYFLSEEGTDELLNDCTMAFFPCKSLSMLLSISEDSVNVFFVKISLDYYEFSPVIVNNLRLSLNGMFNEDEFCSMFFFNNSDNFSTFSVSNSIISLIDFIII